MRQRATAYIGFVSLGAAVSIMPTVGFATGSATDRLTVTMPFEIPSQSLEDALYAFDLATGIEVFADGRTVAGRRSTALRGVYTSAQALRTLLIGTGLATKRIGSDAITIFLDTRPHEIPKSEEYHAYSAFVQSAVLRALCDRPEVRPGNYRAALRLWLYPSGVVSRTDLLSSTGDPQRDLRIRDVLSDIPVGAAPPPKLPQPIVMVILPRPPVSSGDCSE